MNKDNARDYLPLVQALADGKAIQLNYNGDWKGILEMEPIFPAHFYRIKPEPREIWVNRYPDGLECGQYRTLEEAKLMAGKRAVNVCYREVIE